MELILNFDKAVKKIKKANYSVVGLQLPEGLKPKACLIAKTISEKCNCEVIINAEPCFGACDLADEKLKSLGAQALLHVGHLPLLEKTAIPVIYVEGKYETKKDSIDLQTLQAIEKKIKEKKIALIATAQYTGFLEDMKAGLEKTGKKALIGGKTKRTPVNGQVLGCDFSTLDNTSMEFDAILFIGDGLFHPLGATIYSSKPVYVYRPHSKDISLLDKSFKDKFLKKRFGLIDAASRCKVFGVAVSRKKGQERLSLAKELVEKIKKSGKTAFLIDTENISAEQLTNLDLDCYVNTACPRITSDGIAKLNKPVVSPAEIEIALGLRKWEDFELDSLSG